MPIKQAWIALALGALVGVSTASAENLVGRNIGVTCFGCHGPDGKSRGVVPSLHGKSADEIVRKLQAFRAGQDPDATIMDRIARGYTEAEMRAVAEFFAHLP